MMPNQVPEGTFVHCKNRPEARELLRSWLDGSNTLCTFPVENADKADKADYEYLFRLTRGRGVCFRLHNKNIDYYPDLTHEDLKQIMPDANWVEFSDLELPYSPEFMTCGEAFRWLERHSEDHDTLQIIFDYEPVGNFAEDHSVREIVDDFPVDTIIALDSDYVRKKETAECETWRKTRTAPEKGIDKPAKKGNSRKPFQLWDYEADIYVKGTGEMRLCFLDNCPDEETASKKLLCWVHRNITKNDSEYLTRLRETAWAAE